MSLGRSPDADRIARGLQLHREHEDWSPRMVLAALDCGEDSPEFHDARNAAEGLTTRLAAAASWREAHEQAQAKLRESLSASLSELLVGRTIRHVQVTDIGDHDSAACVEVDLDNDATVEIQVQGEYANALWLTIEEVKP